MYKDIEVVKLADSVTNTRILAVGFEYTKQDDGTQKTVYLKIYNPKTNLTEAGIKENVAALISGTNPLLKTPDSQTFDTDTAIVTAYTESVERTDFDIGVN